MNWATNVDSNFYSGQILRDAFIDARSSMQRTCETVVARLHGGIRLMRAGLLVTTFVLLICNMNSVLAFGSPEHGHLPSKWIPSPLLRTGRAIESRHRRSLSTHPKRMRPDSHISHPAQPSFVTSEMQQHMNVKIGNPAYLHCLVMHQGRNNVAWIKNENSKLLTIKNKKFSSDGRYVMSYRESTNDYCLIIRYVIHNDSGSYTCEIGTDPPIRYQVTLTVTEYDAAIFGPKSVWIGGTISLRCEIYLKKLKANESFDFPHIRWYHDRRAMVFEGKRFQHTEPKLSEDNSTLFAELNIMNVAMTDEGLYGCAAPGITPKALKIEINGPAIHGLHPLMSADDPGANTAAQKNKAAASLPPHCHYFTMTLFSVVLSTYVSIVWSRFSPSF